MDQKIKDLWVKRLENPDTKQTTGTLCLETSSGERSFCCLGVLTDIAVENDVIKEQARTGDTDQEFYDSWHVYYQDREDHAEGAVLPGLVSEWAGTGSDNPNVKLTPDHFQRWGYSEEDIEEIFYGRDPQEITVSLSEANDDHHLNFSQIAELIREQL